MDYHGLDIKVETHHGPTVLLNNVTEIRTERDAHGETEILFVSTIHALVTRLPRRVVREMCVEPSFEMHGRFMETPD